MLKTENYQERQETLSNWPVKVVSYNIGTTFSVFIYNQDPGACIARAQASSLEEALREAREKASSRLAKTKLTS